MSLTKLDKHGYPHCECGKQAKYNVQSGCLIIWKIDEDGDFTMEDLEHYGENEWFCEGCI